MTKPRGSHAPRLDLYQQVTNQIIEALEQGVRPWTKPWSAEHLAGRVSRPLRACGKNYRGINVLILWLTATAKSYRSPYWLTFKQTLDLGGHARKGEKGAPVCYYDTFTKETVDDTGTSHEERIPFLKHYTVFNAEQCEGLAAHFHPPAAPEPTPEAEAGRIAAVDRFIASLDTEIVHGGNRACYAQHPDRISMPPFASFTTPDAYYSTLLHEVVHSTKHPSRLNRDCSRKHWGDEGYAREELVAELGSAFLCADFEIGLSERDDHASYIASWIAVLVNDKRAIFHAAAQAERAAAWLHAQQPAAGDSPQPLSIAA
ncbi:MAG: ArdC family protein [Parvibaculaceae bacterium]